MGRLPCGGKVCRTCGRCRGGRSCTMLPAAAVSGGIVGGSIGAAIGAASGFAAGALAAAAKLSTRTHPYRPSAKAFITTSTTLAASTTVGAFHGARAGTGGGASNAAAITSNAHLCICGLEESENLTTK